jgi:hypothetical protein
MIFLVLKKKDQNGRSFPVHIKFWVKIAMKMDEKDDIPMI